ncbi:ABC transporter permease [Streptomyces sp. NPDC058000]|uniref:ABC transporter permease n=1 Tax=Streptomyces sp. NPDC058000 TaxID=3346299 RepID=UPI0036EE56BB
MTATTDTGPSAPDRDRDTAAGGPGTTDRGITGQGTTGRGGARPARLRAWQAGLRRGGIELRHLLRNRKELSGYLTNVVVALLLATFISDDVPGTRIPMAQLTLAGFAAYLLFQIGLISLPQILVTEREEGTLLRLRTTPGGIPAYLIAKSLLIVVMALGTLVVLLGAGAVLVDGPLPHSPVGWVTLLWVTALGLLAVVPLGAAIGAVLPNPREALAMIMLPAMALLVTSGAMFPISRMPTVVQNIASVFPLRWMAQGLRAALLPDAARAVEPAGSWQLPTVALVLAAWAVLGFLLAIPLLRRAARRESGSRLTARQSKAQLSGARPA